MGDRGVSNGALERLASLPVMSLWTSTGRFSATSLCDGAEERAADGQRKGQKPPGTDARP